MPETQAHHLSIPLGQLVKESKENFDTGDSEALISLKNGTGIQLPNKLHFRPPKESHQYVEDPLKQEEYRSFKLTK